MNRRILWAVAFSAAATLAHAENLPADNTLSNALKEITELKLRTECKHTHCTGHFVRARLHERGL